MTPRQNPPSRQGKAHSLWKALVGVPRTMMANRGAAARPSGAEPLAAALPGELRELATLAGMLCFYADAPDADSRAAQAKPLLLIHSINAAGSAYEVRPLYLHYRHERPVYALELPGFGFSERSDRDYTPRLMTDAVLAMAAEIRRIHGEAPFDALAISLASEFLARASSEHPSLFGTLALVSPTGFNKSAPYEGPAGSTRGKPLLKRVFTAPLWRDGLFKLLCSRASIRYFLQKTWGSKFIDEDLLEYDYKSTHQPGAAFAPYCFISGFLFSADITTVYRSLTVPVLMVHGQRGDFVDYSYEEKMRSQPNWSFETFDTGAMPHFEAGAQFIAVYEAFVASHGAVAVLEKVDATSTSAVATTTMPA